MDSLPDRRVENVDLAVKLIGKVQSRSQFWKGFTPEECKLMGSEVEIIRYKAGERIMRTGDQADFVALILSGGARRVGRLSTRTTYSLSST